MRLHLRKLDIVRLFLVALLILGFFAWVTCGTWAAIAPVMSFSDVLRMVLAIVLCALLIVVGMGCAALAVWILMAGYTITNEERAARNMRQAPASAQDRLGSHPVL
jgi:hypothetical protein